MGKIRFTKMSGALNDFIIIDNRTLRLDVDHLKDWIVSLCKRKHSIGADGMIFIQTSERADFGWRFFNCDGSEADMCGNGARCAARFSALEGLSGPRLSFETRAGLIHAEVNHPRVKIQMPDPKALKLNVQLSTQSSPIMISKIDTGVPHAVTEVRNLDAFTHPTLRELGRAIRRHKYFEPAGANVDFIEVVSPSLLKVKTYERGVEDLTCACGTGVVASALIAHAKKMVRSPVTVETIGGSLKVYFKCENKQYMDVHLEGDARVIYKGELSDEAV